jgi:hypothetical protein
MAKNKITLNELKTLVRQVINEEITPQDRSHLADVKDRIQDEEIEIPGVASEDAAQWVEENKDEIVRLGRKGYNPFDTVDIILGNEPEDNIDEDLYHAVILTPNGYLYLSKLRKLDKDKVSQFQRLLKELSNDGDFDISVYRTDDTVDTEEKFDRWRNSDDFDMNSVAIGFRREY